MCCKIALYTAVMGIVILIIIAWNEKLVWADEKFYVAIFPSTKECMIPYSSEEAYGFFKSIDDEDDLDAKDSLMRCRNYEGHAFLCVAPAKMFATIGFVHHGTKHRLIGHDSSCKRITEGAEEVINTTALVELESQLKNPRTCGEPDIISLEKASCDTCPCDCNSNEKGANTNNGGKKYQYKVDDGRKNQYLSMANESGKRIVRSAEKPWSTAKNSNNTSGNATKEGESKEAVGTSCKVTQLTKAVEFVNGFFVIITLVEIVFTLFVSFIIITRLRDSWVKYKIGKRSWLLVLLLYFLSMLIYNIFLLLWHLYD